jgi:hypothetical protein
MGIWALYNPKLPIWPLIGLPDLAGDPQVQSGISAGSSGAAPGSRCRKLMAVAGGSRVSAMRVFVCLIVLLLLLYNPKPGRQHHTTTTMKPAAVSGISISESNLANLT